MREIAAQPAQRQDDGMLAQGWLLAEWPDDVKVAHYGGQLLSGLLSHHVLGVPDRPVRARLANPLLVLTVRSRRTLKRSRQIARGIKDRLHEGLL